MPKSATNSPSDTPPIATPGKLFELKRKENGWTQKEISEALLLSISQVEALENDEYDKLPEATYIIGYWRSYSNLLKIDASESIEFYKNKLDGSDSAIALDAHHRRAHGQHEKNRKSIAWLFCVLAVILLAGIWYWQNPDDNPISQWIENQPYQQLTKINVNNDGDAIEGINGINGIDGSDESQSAVLEGVSVTAPEVDQSVTISLPEPNFSTSSAVPENSENQLSNESSNEAGVEPNVAQEQEVEVAQPESIQDSVQSSETLSEASSSQSAASQSAASQSTASQSAASQSTASQSAASQSTASQSTASQSSAGNSDEQAPETKTPQADSPHWIFFKVEKEAWLDVRDITGEKLIYRTAHKGETIPLYGNPPFYVFLGVADGVLVEYLGEPIDAKSDDGIFARFKVGQVVQGE